MLIKVAYVATTILIVLPENGSNTTGAAMQSSLTVKGQVTIPKAMRDYLGLKPGAQVRFAYTADGGVAIQPAAAAAAPVLTASRFAKLKGINRGGWVAQGGKSTDDIMAHLRGYGDDRRDPGFRPEAKRRK
jgi:AbrB family looped-hinge helix DNA binding protein